MTKMEIIKEYARKNKCSTGKAVMAYEIWLLEKEGATRREAIETLWTRGSNGAYIDHRQVGSECRNRVMQSIDADDEALVGTDYAFL